MIEQYAWNPGFIDYSQKMLATIDVFSIAQSQSEESLSTLEQQDSDTITSLPTQDSYSNGMEGQFTPKPLLSYAYAPLTQLHGFNEYRVQTPAAPAATDHSSTLCLDNFQPVPILPSQLFWKPGKKAAQVVIPDYLQKRYGDRLTLRLLQDDSTGKMYCTTRSLFKGGFGKVRYGIDIQSGNLCAIKVTRYQAKLLPDGRPDPRSTGPVPIDQLYNEWHMTKSANPHFQILDTLDIENKQYTIFQPLMHDNVYNLMWHTTATQRTRLAAVLGVKISQQLVEIHQRNIVHCDLKSDNVLWRYDAFQNRIHVFISDFGQALRLNGSDQKFMYFGSCIGHEVLIEGKISKAADVWALGILLAQIHVPQSRHPFHYILDTRGSIHRKKSTLALKAFFTWRAQIKDIFGNIDLIKLQKLYYADNSHHTWHSKDYAYAKKFHIFFSTLARRQPRIAVYLLQHVLTAPSEPRHTAEEVTSTLEEMNQHFSITDHDAYLSLQRHIANDPSIQVQEALEQYSLWLRNFS